MPTSLTDQDLVQEAPAGSRTAAELSIRRHERRVYRMCFATTRRADDAMGLTRDALLRAFSKLDSFDGRGSLQAWLLQVKNRICLIWLRHRGRRSDAEELTERNAPASAPN